MKSGLRKCQAAGAALLGGSSRAVTGGSHIVAPASLSEQQNGDAKHDRHVCHIEDACS